MFSFKLGSSIQLGKYELGGSCGCLNCTKCHCYRGCIYMTRTTHLNSSKNHISADRDRALNSNIYWQTGATLAIDERHKHCKSKTSQTSQRGRIRRSGHLHLVLAMKCGGLRFEDNCFFVSTFISVCALFVRLLNVSFQFCHAGA